MVGRSRRNIKEIKEEIKSNARRILAAKQQKEQKEETKRAEKETSRKREANKRKDKNNQVLIPGPGVNQLSG